MNKRLMNFVTITILVLTPIVNSAQAQTGQSGYQRQELSPAEPARPQTRQIIAVASGESVRFTSLGELLQMRIEVRGPSGGVLFDSDFKAGNLIDWPVADKQGQRLTNGSYLCVVSVRDSSGLISRRHVIASVHDQSVSLSQSDNSLLTAAQLEAAGTLDSEGGLTILERGLSPASAVLAQDGSTAHLVSGGGGLSISTGDFFANRMLEHIRLTAEGNVGIGINNPQARLDVDGMIRATQGIVFPDGSVQVSAARKTFGTASEKPGQFGKKSSSGKDDFETQSTGTGTQDRLAKWKDNAGTLGDSTIVDVNGNIGIGTPSPQSGLDYHNSGAALFTRDLPTNPGNAVSALQLGVSNAGSRNVGVGPSFLFFGENSAGAKSFLGRVSGVWENPTAGAEAGAIFFQVRANSADSTALTERMRISSNGNVGIGTSNPGSKLSVAGVIESTSGGFKFPDGTFQNTAMTSVTHDTSLTGKGVSGSPLGVAFPLSSTGSSANPWISTSNTGAGNGIQGTSAGGIGVVGLSTDNEGVYGQTSSGVKSGVFGQNFGGGNAVTGTANTTLASGAAGVSGINLGAGYGVKGTSAGDAVVGFGRNGVHGQSASAADSGVWGENTGGGYGVTGTTNSTAASGIPGVLGQNTGTGVGVKGKVAPGGIGVYGDNGGSNTSGYAGFFSGRVQATGNLDANNLPGVSFTQSNCFSSECQVHKSGGEEFDIDQKTINVPAAGFLFISAFVQLQSRFGDIGGQFFKLIKCDDASCASGSLLIEADTVFYNNTTLPITWVLPVNAGQVTLKIRLETLCDISFDRHNLTAIYLPKQY